MYVSRRNITKKNSEPSENSVNGYDVSICKQGVGTSTKIVVAHGCPIYKYDPGKYTYYSIYRIITEFINLENISST